MNVTASPDSTGPATSAAAANPSPTAGAANVTITANISDSSSGGSNVSTAEYFFNSTGANGSGFIMGAQDGSFNAVTESVTANVTGFAPRTNPTIYVHGKDAAGNWGGFQFFTLVVTAADTSGPLSSALAVTPNPTSGAATITITANVSDAATGSSNVIAAEYFFNSAGANGTGFFMNAQDNVGNWGPKSSLKVVISALPANADDKSLSQETDNDSPPLGCYCGDRKKPKRAKISGLVNLTDVLGSLFFLVSAEEKKLEKEKVILCIKLYDYIIL